jgi:hypothetical protein
MEVSGQTHDLAAMPREPIEYNASWVPESVWTFWEKIAPLPLPVFEPHPTLSQVTIPTALSRLSILLTCLFDVFLIYFHCLFSLSFHLYICLAFPSHFSPIFSVTKPHLRMLGLYSIGDVWREYIAMVQWYWKGNLKYSESNLSQCHFVHHIPHMKWAGVEPGPLQWVTGN